MSNIVVLKPGREKSLLRQHPWVFSGAVAHVKGSPQAGETVTIQAADGRFLAWAAWSPTSQIRARVWSFSATDTIDASFIAQRITMAINRRIPLQRQGLSNGWRLIHAEADGLPGLIVDQYDQTLVIQVLNTGAEYWRATIIHTLATVTQCTTIYERSDADVRALEGLSPQCQLSYGETLPAQTTIVEHGIIYAIDIEHGHKTGFYLDQRDNRAWLGQLVNTFEKPPTVLNCFCYTGGFSLMALRHGAAQVTSIDSAAPALKIAQQQAQLNQLDPARAEWCEADVFTELRQLRNQNKKYDIIILDPPKFAPTHAHVEKAARAYKDINLLALKLLAPNGYLLTFSCSSGMDNDLFRKIVAGAAADAGVNATIEHTFRAAADHPVLLSCPESEYLKGLALRLTPN